MAVCCKATFNNNNIQISKIGENEKWKLGPLLHTGVTKYKPVFYIQLAKHLSTMLKIPK